MDVSNISSSEREELDRIADYLRNSAMAQEKIEELSEFSFRQWFAESLQILATGIGISLSAVVEYVKTIGCALSTGFMNGISISREKGERERERLRQKRRR